MIKANHYYFFKSIPCKDDELQSQVLAVIMSEVRSRIGQKTIASLFVPFLQDDSESILTL